MTLALDDARVARLLAGLSTGATPGVLEPPAPAERAPISVLYGGAQLFGAGSFAKLGELARRTLLAHVRSDDDLCAVVGERARPVAAEVRARLVRRFDAGALEDLRIDFEDGYGARSEAEEDRDADRVGETLAGALVETPPWLGVRTKAFDRATGARAARTLLRVFAKLAQGLPGGGPPRTGFVVTLPKVRDRAQIAAFAELLALVEASSGIAARAIGIELMIESPEALFDPSGALALRGLVAAGDGRVGSVHLGAYDLLSAAGVPASAQSLGNPLCGAARAFMQLGLAGTGVRVVDGATTRLPLPVHRAASLSPHELAENRAAIQGALREHADHVEAALQLGIHQGWDLHPAQLVGRYAAVYTHYLTGLDLAAARLVTFLERAATASATGQAFDDAATVHGLLGFFRRGISCGALTEADLTARGVPALTFTFR